MNLAGVDVNSGSAIDVPGVLSSGITQGIVLYMVTILSTCCGVVRRATTEPVIQLRAILNLGRAQHGDIGEDD